MAMHPYAMLAPTVDGVLVDPEEYEEEPDIAHLFSPTDMSRRQTSRGLLEKSCMPSLAFVEGLRFQTAIAIVIIFNTVVLGIETDLRWSYWPRVEDAFLATFLLELVLRILFQGWNFLDLYDGLGWNLFDVLVVGFGVSEAWLVPLVSMEARVSTPTTALRCLRLLRLLRLLRVFRLFEHTRKFVDALISMLPTVMWIFCILFGFCYVTAIILTHMLGKAELVSEDVGTEDQEELTRSFGDVLTTMFNLFRILTMDSWSELVAPVTERLPLWRLIFIGFISMGSWTMISVLTAVVSDFMVGATTDLKQIEDKRLHSDRLSFMAYLRAGFHEADKDGNGKLTRSEFLQWAAEPGTLRQLHKVGISFRKEELVKLFDALDIDHSHQLSVDNFVDGLARAQESLGMKHMLKLEHLFKRVERKALASADLIERVVETDDEVESGVEERLDDLVRQVDDLLREQRAVLEDQAKASEVLWRMRCQIEEATAAATSPNSTGVVEVSC